MSTSKPYSIYGNPSDRMFAVKTALVIALLTVGIFLLVVGLLRYRTLKNATSGTLIAQTDTTTGEKPAANPQMELQRGLLREERRLSQLRETFSSVENKQNSVDDIHNQVDALNTSLRDLRNRSSDLGRTSGQVAGEANTYQREQQIKANDSVVQLQSELAANENAQLALKSAPSRPAAPAANPESSNGVTSNQSTAANNSPPAVDARGVPSATNPVPRTEGAGANNVTQQRLNELEARKNTISVELKQVQTEAQTRSLIAAQTLQDAQDQILEERQDLQRQIADTQEQLNYWNAQLAKNSGDENLRSERLGELEKKIAAEERQVRDLREHVARQ